MSRISSNHRADIFQRPTFHTECDGHRNQLPCLTLTTTTTSPGLIKQGWYCSVSIPYDICHLCVIDGVELLGTPHPDWKSL